MQIILVNDLDKGEKKKKGRRKKDFDQEKAQRLLALGYSYREVGNILGICRRTLKRSSNNQISSKYTKISNEELDELVRSIKSEHYQIGEKRLLGILKGKGICIQRQRLRDSVNRVDPFGAIQRCNAGIAQCNARTSTEKKELQSLRVKKDKVEICENVKDTQQPRILRIDSVSKLTKWNITIEFGIDMSSRFITYIKAFNLSDQFPANLFNTFSSSTDNYKMPDKVILDEREANFQIFEYLNEKKLEIIKPERVQWITLFKKDMFSNVLSSYVYIFQELETEGSLNILNKTDLFCLYFVYLPRLNRSLVNFVSGHNLSALPHNQGVTPQQKYFRDNDCDTNLLGILANNDIVTQAEIDLATISPISEEHLQQLCGHVNPLEDSQDFGKGFYYRTGTFVAQCLSGMTLEINEVDVEGKYVAEKQDDNTSEQSTHFEVIDSGSLVSSENVRTNLISSFQISKELLESLQANADVTPTSGEALTNITQSGELENKIERKVVCLEDSESQNEVGTNVEVAECGQSNDNTYSNMEIACEGQMNISENNAMDVDDMSQYQVEKAVIPTSGNCEIIEIASIKDNIETQNLDLTDGTSEIVIENYNGNIFLVQMRE